MGSPSTSSSPRPTSGSARFASGARSPGRTERTLLGHDGDEIAVQHLDHALDDLGSNARVTERQHVRAEQQHRSRLLARERRADRGGVGADDPELERVGLSGFDAFVRQRAEPGRHAVDGRVRRHGAFDHVAGGADPVQSPRPELHLGAGGHLDDVLERERLPDPDRHGARLRRAPTGGKPRLVLGWTEMSNPWDDLEPTDAPARAQTGPETPGPNARAPERVHGVPARSDEAMPALRLGPPVQELVQDPRSVPAVRPSARARGGRVPRRDDDELHVHGTRLARRARVWLAIDLPDLHVPALTIASIAIAALVPLLFWPFSKTIWASVDYLIYRTSPDYGSPRGRRPRERQRRPPARSTRYSRQGSRTPRSAATASASS